MEYSKEIDDLLVAADQAWQKDKAAIKERDDTIAEVWSILTGWDKGRLANNTHVAADDPRKAVIEAAKKAVDGRSDSMKEMLDVRQCLAVAKEEAVTLKDERDEARQACDRLLDAISQGTRVAIKKQQTIEAERDEAIRCSEKFQADNESLRKQLKQVTTDAGYYFNETFQKWQRIVQESPAPSKLWDPDADLAAVLDRVRRLERWINEYGPHTVLGKEIAADVKAGK